MPGDEIRTDLGVTLDYPAIARGAQADERAMHKALSLLTRDDALFHCARVNTIATAFDPNFSHFERQKRLAETYCDVELGNAINAFVNKHRGKNVSVFFQGQMLELARWVTKFCRHDPNDGDTFSDGKVRSAFVRAAIIAGDFWGARVYGGRISDIGGPEEALLRARGPFRKGMEESGQSEHLGTAIARGWLFFSKYLPRRLPDFPALFAQATGMTIENYFTCAVSLMLYTFPTRSEGPLFRTYHVAGSTAVPEVFRQFIAVRGQSPESLKKCIWDDFQKRGYRGLRTRPIINFPRERSAIFDPAYFTECVSITPLFDVFSVANPKHVLGAFGGAFEDYILDFLREIFPTVTGLTPRLICNIEKKNGAVMEFECDAILNDVLEVSIFEVKAAWIREDAVLTDDPGDFIDQLRKKYGVSSTGSDDKEERKGVAQLARSIGAIARGEWTGPERELSQAKTFYPVLIVHDQRLSYPGSAVFLNQEFRRYLGELPRGIYAHNLIILTVADIEILASSVENFGFMAFLKDYSAQVPDRTASVHTFMARSTQYREKLKPSKKLMETSSWITDEIKRVLFPPKDDTPGVVANGDAHGV